jgi:hypothetical protein
MGKVEGRAEKSPKHKIIAKNLEDVGIAKRSKWSRSKWSK